MKPEALSVNVGFFNDRKICSLYGTMFSRRPDQDLESQYSSMTIEIPGI